VLGQKPPRSLPGQAPLRAAAPTAAPGARLLAVALLLGGCTSVAEVTGTAAQQDVTLLRADVTAMQTRLGQVKTQVDTLAPQVESRLREQAVESERQSAAAMQRMEGLSATVTALSKRVDDLHARLEALSRQLRAGTGPVPEPPGTPPSAPGLAPPPAMPSTAAPTPPPGAAQPPGARPHTGALQPQDVYQAAYIDFSKGNYLLAVSGFREFLRRYVEHELAANAQYWIGESNLAMARVYTDRGEAEPATGALQQAVQEFRRVLANYPRSDKAPAALYKEALALLELKQPAQAQARLQYLIETFPQAEETLLARERLAALREH
jgi:tol-pal system protein YbgF